MAITSTDIKSKSKPIPHPEVRSDIGMFRLDPEVKLVCMTNANNGFKKGDIVHAYLLYDEEGKYPNHVQLREHCMWWGINSFEFV